MKRWTKNGVLLQISGAQMHDVYQIELRITSKDGVVSGERVFDILLPRIRFTHQEVKDAMVSRDGAIPHAHWKIQRNAGAVSIKKIIIDFSYVDPDISIEPKNQRIEYGWDDSSDSLLLGGNEVSGFTATVIGGYLECDLEFPADFELPAVPPDYAVSILGCSFRVTVEDEFGFPATAESSGFGSASPNYAVKWEGHYFYASLQDAAAAITAAGAGIETNPDVITVFTDISMADNITIPPGKNVKIKSDTTRRTLKRASGNTAALFTVNGQLTLENIIVDGGAVCTGGTAAPPSPAFGATNAGLNAANTLVLVNGGSAKLTLGAGAVLQNNYSEGGSIPDNLGGGIRATGGAQVVINGAGAAVRYNFAGWTGGGIALFDSPAQQGTKLTLINGSIDNNKAVWGGGITTEYGSIDMRGGFVTKNYASSAGGGINFSNCNNGLSASISGGSISENRADYGGGIRIEKQWAITMSGSAVISGNTATTNGSGVYMENGTFKMAGGAVVHANNEVYLVSGKTITIDGDLTGTAPVATIRPATYSTTTTVLNGTALSTNYGKFAVTPDGSTQYTIDSAGKLALSP